MLSLVWGEHIRLERGVGVASGLAVLSRSQRPVERRASATEGSSLQR